MSASARRPPTGPEQSAPKSFDDFELRLGDIMRGERATIGAPFPSDPHYDAKAWETMTARKGPGRVVFWNVAGPARP
jgi:hypothetical protein